MEKYRDSGLATQERVADLLSRMTLEEKVAQMDMIRGVELATKVHPAHFCAVDEASDFKWDKVRESLGTTGMGFVHDIYSVPKVLNKIQKYMVEETRLGIPCIFTGEALHGFSYPGSMIFPMPIGMAAAFDPELTKEVGHAIASEARSIGIHEILAPNLDLAREPRWGRVEETFGEDTYLASQMAYAIISGQQGEDVSANDAVLAEPKHYCVHGIPENGTNCSPARVGVREIETAYLPVFEAGIKAAGAYNAMASYNCIDGEAVICSEHYLRKVLKERYGLKGYVRADFGAVKRLQDTHFMTVDNKQSIEWAVNGGLDVQGFDFPNAVWQQSLIELVQEGRIRMEIIDDAVGRVLRAKFDLGLFEHPYTDEERYKEIVRSEKHKQISYKMAQESLVMLQNNGGLLPLSKDIKSIAVVGPSSGSQRIGSYSSVPYGYKVESVCSEIKKKLGVDCIVRQVDGCGVTEQDVDKIPKDWYVDGVELSFYNNDSFTGDPAGVEHAQMVNFNWILAKPHKDLDFKGYSVRMRMKLKINTYQFVDADRFSGKLVFTTSDSVRIHVDGRNVMESFGGNKQRVPSCEFEFVNGAIHDVMIEFVCDVNGNQLMLGVDHHENNIEQAVEAARQSDVVVLVCGDNTVTSGEGMDRCDLKLHGVQLELIREISKVGKPCVLVLENGKPLDLSFETAHMDSILEAWFGGEFGAKAIADVIFGDVNPSGRLPVSFPKSVGYIPCYYSQLPGGSTAYLEGERKARYSFGYGLSYTTFAYSGLHIDKSQGTYDYVVTVNVSNTGSVAGDEVAQLYVEDICSSIVTPRKLLKGFKRVSLRPGEEKTIRFELGYDHFKLLDKQFQWVVEPGEFRIMVGGGSEDIRCEEIIKVV